MKRDPPTHNLPHAPQDALSYAMRISPAPTLNRSPGFSPGTVDR